MNPTSQMIQTWKRANFVCLLMTARLDSNAGILCVKLRLGKKETTAISMKIVKHNYSASMISVRLPARAAAIAKL